MQMTLARVWQADCSKIEQWIFIQINAYIRSIQCIDSFNSMDIFIQFNGCSIQWIFNSMDIQFNAYSIQCIFNSMDIQFNAYSIQCIFNSMHIQFNAYSIQWIFNSMHIQFNGYSFQCIFNSTLIQFHIQRFIQHSIIHLIQRFIQHSTIPPVTIHSNFPSPHSSW